MSGRGEILSVERSCAGRMISRGTASWAKRNIYATEALHAAKVRPGRAGKSLRRAEADKLTAACRDIGGRASAYCPSCQR